ncbi:protein LURP-one-related 8-like [Curcuma longa]|uniref:protein LURP-one-related 8-like n=1 Tax=Curcuma longa TaxID=136217 RepID=UPI003D9DF010
MAKVHPNTEENCVDGVEVAGDRKDKSRVLTVWRKSLLFGCSGFTVFDEEGNLVFRVDNYGCGRAGEVVLMDAAGKPLLTVRRKKLSLGENWKVYNGEDSVDPVCSVKKKYASRLHAKAGLARVADCRRRGGRAAARYEVEGSYSRRSCTVYDERRRAVAEVRPKETARGVGFGDDVYRLVVQPAADARLAMAVVVVLDQMFGSRIPLIKG